MATRTRIVSPGPVPKEALDFFMKKNVKVGFNHTDVWKEEHNVAFTIAKVTDVNILQYAKQLVESAIANGMTFRDFQKNLAPQLDQSGWANYSRGRSTPSRIKIIFDTNMRTARAAGQWKRIDRTKATLPFLQYALGPSVKHRPEHVGWAGTILPVDDLFWNTHMPPNGWGCKCHVIQMGDAEAQRLGGKTKRPSVRTVPYRNPSTGKVERVQVGIDPGWNYNPGKNRTKGTNQAAKKAGVPPVPKPAPKKKAKPKDPFAKHRIDGRVVPKKAMKDPMLGDASKFDAKELGKDLVALVRLAKRFDPNDDAMDKQARAFGKRIRQQINHLLAEMGMVSSDVITDAGVQDGWEFIQKPNGIAGTHSSFGGIQIRNSRDYLDAIDWIGSRLSMHGLDGLRDIPNPRTLYVLGVIIHESMHDMSPGVTGSYREFGVLIEEASTEMAANRAMETISTHISKRLIGQRERDPATGRQPTRVETSYKAYQRGLIAAARQFLGNTAGVREQEMLERVTDAAVSMRKGTHVVSSSRSLAIEFISHLDDPGAVKLRKAMDAAEAEWEKETARQLESDNKQLRTRGRGSLRRASNLRGLARIEAAEEVLRDDTELRDRVDDFIDTAQDFYDQAE